MKFWERVANDPWFYGLRLTVLFLLLVLALSWCGAAGAEPIARAEKDGVTITLFTEPCKLTSVKNLEYRSTWTEKGKTFEGCFTIQGGIVVFFWSDLTVGLASGQAFAPLTGL